MNINALNKKLNKLYRGSVTAAERGGVRTLSGSLPTWDDAVAACYLAVKKGMHVVNDIAVPVDIPKMRMPAIRDNTLEGLRVDALVIGGGISGASIARELRKWDISVLLVEKDSDVANGASGRNDGEVHPGIDLKKGSLKQKYVIAGNKMYGRVCEELSVPFVRCGQYVGFTQWALLPFVWVFTLFRRYNCKVEGAKIVLRKKLRAAEPSLNRKFKFAIYTPTAGAVCPYGLTIAYAENAVENGARVSLNTAVTGMTTKNGEILSVATNRGTVYAKVVINAAGVFAEDIAIMAGDRFYSIHPRKGTNSILDKKSAYIINSISSIKKLSLKKSHSKGGGLVHTVHGNVLAGPDARETYKKEDYSTEQSSIDAVFEKQKNTSPYLSKGDIIAYFAGVRAPTFEEDFVIERGRATKNLIHCAGIQSPGLTTAPAAALDIAALAVDILSEKNEVRENKSFNPTRNAPPVLRELSDERRDALIKQKPDYGVVVCRCEEISRGEIIDALRSPLPVPTVDGVKRRVRAGMGRCQGGFCSPSVIKIIAEQEGIPLSDVKKSSAESVILFGKTKEGAV